MTLRSILIPLAGAGLLFSATSNSLADLAVLTPVKDNTLYESTTGSLSNGAGDWFFSGQTNTLDLRRGILAFDLTPIPSDAVIQDVSLVLFMDQTFSNSERTIRVHRVLQDWGEGTTDAEFGEGGGGPATPGSVTWVHTFFDQSFWTNIAGDFVALPSAQTNVGAEGFPYTWTGPGMIADVQNWVGQPAENFGWILIGDEANSGTAKRFRSRENPDSLTVPQLSVTFSISPVTAPPGDFASWGRIKNLFR
ncbi:MAG TPA: DNRLRE domain-containing protein [bacterium]|nr:DNRLRE domain-containing protein [bacterium]